MKSNFAASAFLMMFLFSSTLRAEAPEHFYNANENLNPDPKYTPGDVPLEDTNKARSFYTAEQQELAASGDTASEVLYTLGHGEISFSAVKNETANVLGFFRNYFGVVKIKDGIPVGLTMVIDINSLDTAVPGRNNRILNLLFRSMTPELGTARVEFQELDWGGKSFAEAGDGAVHGIKASGTLDLNGVQKPITASLNLQKQKGIWAVETASPISILISDYQFENRVYELMKSCNHKSIGNQVDVKVELFFK
ncbi:MAG: YceI family protein [Candidatus Omnitrophica bacterium]|nr:YceI family protein [Candidatus Omnitrophota bacterium]